jgi:hypothetical protein
VGTNRLSVFSINIIQLVLNADQLHIIYLRAFALVLKGEKIMLLDCKRKCNFEEIITGYRKSRIFAFMFDCGGIEYAYLC